jgi:pimeloyl-ACP methyl ester carboxylesterase
VNRGVTSAGGWRRLPKGERRAPIGEVSAQRPTRCTLLMGGHLLEGLLEFMYMLRSGFLQRAGAALLISDGTVAKAALATTAGANASFESIKQVDAGELSVGYAETGSANRPVAILLHGWPYDIYAYAEVAALLASAGFRTIVPYLRGFGTTRFHSSQTFRNGEQLVFALDTIALMDALGIESAILAGYDWGGRAADIVAALWPQRCKALVSGQGYLIINVKASEQPSPPKSEYALWFEYYFATERGRLGYGEHRRAFNRLMWHQLSPKWMFDDATYERTAAAFDNPDHVDIVIHNYRTRLGLANGDPRYAALNAKLQSRPIIAAPSITIASDFDGANASGTSYVKQFTGKYAHRIFRGIGHNIPQEDPRGFAQAVIDAEAMT